MVMGNARDTPTRLEVRQFNMPPEKRERGHAKALGRNRQSPKQEPTVPDFVLRNGQDKIMDGKNFRSHEIRSINPAANDG